MMRPRLDAADFILERNVILEEIARSEDVPTGQAYRRMMQTYFRGQSAGPRRAGHAREHRQRWQVEQMREYAARRYAANNLILALAGNFEWEQVRALAEEKCGAWGRGDEGRSAEPYTPSSAATKVMVQATAEAADHAAGVARA